MNKKLESVFKEYTMAELEKIYTKEYRKGWTRPVDSKETIHKIIKMHAKKHVKQTIVMCHGKRHKPVFKNALTCDRSKSVLVQADIIADAWAKNFAKKFPEKHFDKVVTQYCSTGHPFNQENTIFWNNMHYILKEGGVLQSNNTFGLYKIHSPKQHTNTIKKKIRQEFEKLGFIECIFGPIKGDDCIITVKREIDYESD